MPAGPRSSTGSPRSTTARCGCSTCTSPSTCQGTWTNHAPRRKRKLLLHRAEIDKLVSKTKEGGLTLVPLDLYFKDGKVKATLALAKGKKSYDKRHDLAERDSRREIQKAFGRYVKGRR